MKFKVGDEVKFKDISRKGTGTITEIDKNAEHDSDVTAYCIDNYWFFQKEVSDVTITLEDMPEGTVIECENGDTKIVLFVLKPGLYLLSLTDDHEQPDHEPIWSVSKMKSLNFKIKDQDIEELTMKEVCDEIGREIKIKKD